MAFYTVTHAKNLAQTVIYDGVEWLHWSFENGQNIFIKNLNSTTLSSDHLISLPDEKSEIFLNFITRYRGFGQRIFHMKFLKKQSGIRSK